MTDIICHYCQAYGSLATCRYCAGCKVQRYCSSECQRLDWQVHKKNCARLAANRAAIVADNGKEGLRFTGACHQWFSLNLSALATLVHKLLPGESHRDHVLLLDVSSHEEGCQAPVFWITGHKIVALSQSDLKEDDYSCLLRLRKEAFERLPVAPDKWEVALSITSFTGKAAGCITLSTALRVAAEERAECFLSPPSGASDERLSAGRALRSKTPQEIISMLNIRGPARGWS